MLRKQFERQHAENTRTDRAHTGFLKKISTIVVCFHNVLSMTCKTVFRTLFDAGNTGKNGRRISMTRNTIVHRPRMRLFHDVKFLNVTVTLLAGNILVHMNAVIEVSVIRNFVDPFPWHQFAFVKVLSQSNDVRHVLPRNGMTIHTCVEGWNHCVTGF